MRRVWMTAIYLALIVLVLTLMALAGRPVEEPVPLPSPTPSATPEPTGPTVIVITGSDGLDGLWGGIQVEGMPE